MCSTLPQFFVSMKGGSFNWCKLYPSLLKKQSLFGTVIEVNLFTVEVENVKENEIRSLILCARTSVVTTYLSTSSIFKGPFFYVAIRIMKINRRWNLSMHES